MTYLNPKILMLTGLILVGAAGVASAEADYRDVVRDSEGQVVHSTDGQCVRSSWYVDRDLCASQPIAQRTVRVAQQTVTQRQEVRRAATLTQEDRTVYFKFNRAALTPEGKERLGTLANVLKSDESVKDAKVVGYADRIGSDSYNEKLSQKRAETVRDYLIANGYTNASVTETRWVGESEPSTSCPAEKRAKLIECLHNDRRVEVEIGYVQQ